MARKSRPDDVLTGTVSIEVEGRTYTGDYTARDRWMTVNTSYGSKSALAAALAGAARGSSRCAIPVPKSGLQLVDGMG